MTGRISKYNDGSYSFSDDEGTGFVVGGAEKPGSKLTEEDKKALIEDFELERRNLVARFPKDFPHDLRSELPGLRAPRGTDFRPGPAPTDGCCFDPTIELQRINDALGLCEWDASYDPEPRAGAPAGVMSVQAVWKNVSPRAVAPILFVASALTDGNLLMNADSRHKDVGSHVFVDQKTLGPGGLLAAGSNLAAEFTIGLHTRDVLDFSIDVYGARLRDGPSFFSGFDPIDPLRGRDDTRRP